MMQTDFVRSHRVGIDRLSSRLRRANSLKSMHRHDNLIRILGSGAWQLTTEDFHFVASFAKSAGQAPTWMAGSNPVHFHNSVRCHRYQILPIVEDALKQSEDPAASVISPGRYGCAEVAVRNPVQREPHRKPDRKAHSPRVRPGHWGSCHAQNRHLGDPCHLLKWGRQRLPQDPFSRLSHAFSALAHTRS